MVNSNFFSISHRFRVIRDFRYNGISYLGPPKLGVFAPKIPQNGEVSTRPPKGTSLHGSTCFGTLGAAVWRAVRPERGEKKLGKKKFKKNKKPQVVYISPHRPDDPRRGANLKLCPLRQTPEIINHSNFQLDPPTSFGSTGGRSWGSPIVFPNDSYN